MNQMKHKINQVRYKENRQKKQLNTILSRNTGQPLKKIEADTDRDNFMTSAQAKSYGIIDTVLTKRK